MLYKWRFSAPKQTLSAPSGLTISVAEIAHWVQDRVHGRADLTGQWAGWKIRGSILTGPSGQRHSLASLKIRDLKQP